MPPFLPRRHGFPVLAPLAPPRPPRARPPPPADSACRVCHEPAVPGGADPLLSPCGCAGSLRFVHRDCLETWRAVGGPRARDRCDVCLERYPLRQPRTLRARLAASPSARTGAAFFAFFAVLGFVSGAALALLRSLLSLLAVVSRAPWALLDPASLSPRVKEGIEWIPFASAAAAASSELRAAYHGGGQREAWKAVRRAAEAPGRAAVEAYEAFGRWAEGVRREEGLGEVVDAQGGR